MEPAKNRNFWRAYVWFRNVFMVQLSITHTATIRSAGFDAVSLWWGDELQDKNSQPEMARKLGLDIEMNNMGDHLIYNYYACKQ